MDIIACLSVQGTLLFICQCNRWDFSYVIARSSFLSLYKLYHVYHCKLYPVCHCEGQSPEAISLKNK